MGLSDYFRKKNEPVASTPITAEYWNDVESLCRGHIQKTSQFFRSHNAPRLEWAAPRFLQLIEPSATRALINVARARLQQLRIDSVTPPIIVGRFGSWFVCVTVFPSAADSDFVKRCPNSRFEDYIEDCRRAFHSFEPTWPELDYAQWIFLLKPEEHDASIHLYTHWSIVAHTEWLAQMRDSVVMNAPIIVPTELFKESLYDFERRIFAIDLEALEQDASTMGNQVAKLLFMDSIVSEAPIEPFNPLECRRADGQPLDFLGELLEVHRADCEKIKVDIPLIVGVPADSAKAVETHFRIAEYKGLKPERVFVCAEPEAPFSQPDDSFIIRDKYRMRNHLLGGGVCLAQIIESGLLSKLWKEGIRWLLIGQVFNRGARIDSSLLKRLARCRSSGLFEVVKRGVVPESKLVLLEREGRPICVDDRRLRSPNLQRLRTSPYVGDGTFWIRCEKLAEAFGIKREMLDAEWNRADWEDKLTKQLLESHAILGRSEEMAWCMTVPVWEAFSSLELDVLHVGADRINMVLAGIHSL